MTPIVTFTDPLAGLTDTQQRVLDAISSCREPDAIGTFARMAGTSPPHAGRALRELERRGLAEPAVPARAPIWWQAIAPAPADFVAPHIAKDQRWYRDGWRRDVFVEITSSEQNEFGCWSVGRRDADDVHLHTWVPPHLLARDFSLDEAPRTVTEWSSQFICPIHGECGIEMVKTDKTCALCGSGLIRA